MLDKQHYILLVIWLVFITLAVIGLAMPQPCHLQTFPVCETVDNQVTNQLVRDGLLPTSESEIYPQN